MVFQRVWCGTTPCVPKLSHMTWQTRDAFESSPRAVEAVDRRTFSASVSGPLSDVEHTPKGNPDAIHRSDNHNRRPA